MSLGFLSAPIYKVGNACWGHGGRRRGVEVTYQLPCPALSILSPLVLQTLLSFSIRCTRCCIVQADSWERGKQHAGVV